MRVEEVLFTSAFADPATSKNRNLFRAVGLDTSVPGGVGTTVYANSNHLLWSFNLDSADYCTRSASIFPGTNGAQFYFATATPEDLTAKFGLTGAFADSLETRSA